jgi:hypothetical protein
MIVLRSLLDCPSCEATFEGIWEDDSLSLQDMAEAPVADQTCVCGHVMKDEEFPGWMFRSEAG